MRILVQINPCKLTDLMFLVKISIISYLRNSYKQTPLQKGISKNWKSTNKFSRWPQTEDDDEEDKFKNVGEGKSKK